MDKLLSVSCVFLYSLFSLLKRLVMNFLVIEGYQDVAEKFQTEASIQPEIPLDSIATRMSIRKFISAGSIEEAIQTINSINPAILETNPDLLFRLQQQRLIELIRSGDIEESLIFAREVLAPVALQNPAHLVEMEQIMSLLAFRDVSNSPLKHLVSMQHRQQLAGKINEAILAAQCHNKGNKISTN